MIKAPKGTMDITPKNVYKWRHIEEIVLQVAEFSGFYEIRTPTFEDEKLFKKSVGETTDVVQKEMFNVTATNSKDVFCLRPEGTASVVRAVLEQSLTAQILPLKLSYVISCFRHERPQAGRLREFHQFGIEMFGSGSPTADVEVILVANMIFNVLGLKNISLNINSIGCKECRPNFHKALKEYFAGHKGSLCDTCLTRLKTNPMRILDCKCPECIEIAKNAPVVIDYLCDECANHFNGVQELLKVAGVSYIINSQIVRGLDYYTKTVFEFISTDLGSQSTVCGGGRYDDLVENMGGKPTKALGFAMGLERLLMIIQAQGIELKIEPKTELYIGSVGEKACVEAFKLCKELRHHGYSVCCDLMERSVKAQLKYADKIGAAAVIIIGDSEMESQKISVKNMSTGEKVETLLVIDSIADTVEQILQDNLNAKFSEN